MLFFTRQFALCLTLIMVVFLTACNEASDRKSSGQATFELIKPRPDSTITIVEENLIVAIRGVVEPDDMRVLINDVDVTSRVSFLGSQLQVGMLAIESALVQGNNVVSVTQVSTNFTQTASFFLDNMAPTITVTNVTAEGAVDALGKPMPGTAILVEGQINDTSDIDSFIFTYPGGSVAVRRVFVETLADDQFSDITKRFRVRLPNYPDTSVPATGSHFSYTIRDFEKQQTTEHFIADGTTLSPMSVTQINDSLLALVNPFVGSAIDTSIGLLRSQNIFGEWTLLVEGGAVPPEPGQFITGPVAGDNVALEIYSSGSTFCNTFLFHPSTSNGNTRQCLLFVRDVIIDNPGFDMAISPDGNKINHPADQLSVNFNFSEVRVNVEIAALDTRSFGSVYLGSLNVSLILRGLKFGTRLDIIQDNPDLLYGLDLTEDITVSVSSPLGPFTQLSCPGNVCNNGALLAAASAGFSLGNVILQDLDGDGEPGFDFNNDGQPDTNRTILTTLADLLNNRAPGGFYDILRNTIVGVNQPAAYNKQATTDAGDTRQLNGENRVANMWNVNNGNLLVTLVGNQFVDSDNYVANAAPANIGLGNPYTAEGSFAKPQFFSSVNFWGNGYAPNDQPYDFVYAVTSNTVNQSLLAHHQSGLFETMSMDITGLTAENLNIESTDELRLSFATTNSAPTVSFQSADALFTSVCIETVANLCVNGTPIDHGFMTVEAKGVDFWIENVTDGVTKPNAALQVNADVVFNVGFGLSGSLPVIMPTTDFVRVTVNGVQQPSDMDAEVIADLLDRSLTEFANNGGLTQMTAPTTSVFDTGDLGTIDIPTEPPLSIAYSTLLRNVTPIEYGMLARWIEVDNSGDFLSLGFDIRASDANLPTGTPGFTDEELAEHLFHVRVE